jgi:hypothetical protein
MTLLELRDAVGNAFDAKLKDLEEKFASPSRQSKGQLVTQLDPESKRFVRAHENAYQAGKATGTNIGHAIKNANGDPIHLYSKTLKANVCFRYANDEEAASITPSADAAKAAFASIERPATKRPSNKHHNTNAIPITQLDPNNLGAFLCTFASINVAAEINGITASLLQSKVKDSHTNGEPYAELFAYSLGGTDAVKCWFRYATDEEAATIPPSMRKRRGRRPKPAPTAASEHPAVGEKDVAESPPSLAPKQRPPVTGEGVKKRPSTKIDEEVEWHSESDESVSEFEGDSDDEYDLD